MNVLYVVIQSMCLGLQLFKFDYAYKSQRNLILFQIKQKIID